MTETKTAPAPKKAAKAAAAAPASFFELPKVEFPAFEMPKFEIPKFDGVEFPAAVREMAEKSLEQAKVTYEKVKAAAEETTDMIEDTYETARAGVVEYNLKALEAAKSNTDALYAFTKDMMAVKTFAEIVELQTSFARKSFDTATAQAKDLQEIATKLANDTAKPMKDAVAKVMKDVKAA
jgi:phasin